MSCIMLMRQASCIQFIAVLLRKGANYANPAPCLLPAAAAACSKRARAPPATTQQQDARMAAEGPAALRMQDDACSMHQAAPGAAADRIMIAVQQTRCPHSTAADAFPHACSLPVTTRSLITRRFADGAAAHMTLHQARYNDHAHARRHTAAACPPA